MKITLPLYDKELVTGLIPQRKPFVMVDALIAFTDTYLKSGIKVNEGNIFTKNTIFQEAGLIEHMAQSVALHTGYQYYLKQQPAPVGYIGSIKKIEIFELPQLGDTIETEVSVLQEFMGVTLVRIQSKINTKVIATGEMKTVIANL